MDGDSVYEFLKSRTGLLDGVVISGGEPTLHKNLSLLCERLKLMGYAVKLDTNGSRPRVIKRLMEEGLVDYIAMDIKTDPYHYPPYINKNGNTDHILDSIQFIMGSSVGYEFRTTCAKRIVDASIVEKIAKIIKGARLYALQRFHGNEILHPEFFQESEGGYNDNEMLFLRSIAKPWVKKCIVR
jgi:pyruvate formate lyase activating enzyme